MVRIAYRMMFTKEWNTFEPHKARRMIVPCQYALVIDGKRTIVSWHYDGIASAARRVRHYRGTIA